MEVVDTPRSCLAPRALAAMVEVIADLIEDSMAAEAVVATAVALEVVEVDSEATDPVVATAATLAAAPLVLHLDLEDSTEETAETGTSVVGMSPEPMDADTTTDLVVATATMAETADGMVAEMVGMAEMVAVSVTVSAMAAVEQEVTWSLSVAEMVVLVVVVAIATEITTDPVTTATESADTMEVVMRTLANCGGTNEHHRWDIRWVF